MKNESRIDKSIKNSSIALIAQFVILLAQFALQTIFARVLGAQYLGANGLFSNILSFLSFTELGVGTAITYELYKPLAEKDEQGIRSVMHLFAQMYKIIGTLIFILGICMSFFIPLLINKNSTIPHVQIMFILYVSNSAISYFFTYKRTLLIANQQSYVDTINRVCFTSVQTVVQVTFLIITKQYVAYLIIQIIFTFLSNVSISFQANKYFPYILSKDVAKMPKVKIKRIKKNILGAIVSKMGTIVAYGTDNVLLSKFMGLAVVGAYSNYILLLTSIQNLANQMLNAVIASIANLANSESSSREEDIFYDFMYLVAGLSFILGLSIYAVIQPFIELWVGKSYILNEFTVFLLIFNWSISVMRSSILGFMTVHGLYWETRWKSAMESIVNLVVGLSLLMFTNLGINSVIIGTLSANLLINSWWEPMILLKNAVKTEYAKYATKYIKYVLFNIVGMAIVYFIHQNELIYINNVVDFIITGFIVFASITLVFGALTFKTKEQQFYMHIVKKRILKRRI